MALKTILDIDVQDSKFQAFFDLFQQYQKRVDSLPDSWHKVNKTTSKSADDFAAIASDTAKSLHHAALMVDQLRRATLAQKQFHQAASSSGKVMRQMASDAKTLASEIFGIGKFLAKLSVIGLGSAAGGLFGLDMLGRSAVNGQRTARGLGLNQGQVKAFDTDFGRFVNPSMLGNVANAQNDFTGRVYLGMAAGLSQNQISSMSPDQLSILLAKRAHDWWKNTSPAMRTSQNLMASGFMQSGFRMEDMRRLGNTPSSDLNKASSQYNRDAKMLNVTDQQVSAWYQLTRQLKLAGQTIETVLINRLSALAPTLGMLTTKLADTLSVFLKTTLTPENINKFADSLKSVVEYLGSDDFKKKIVNFGDAVVKVTDAVLGAAHVIGSVVPSESDWERTKKAFQKGGLNPFSGLFREGVKLKFNPGQSSSGMINYGKTPEEIKIGKIVSGIIAVESGGNPYAVSSSGAEGITQLKKPMQKAWGVTNPFDANQEIDATSRIMTFYLKKYKGDLSKSLAAYNQGETTLDSVLKKHSGSDWMNYMPQEAQKYVPKVILEINNTTSSNVVVQGASAAPVRIK